MRKCYETRNFSGTAGLIEEAQSMANRMESGLDTQKDIKRMIDERTELKKELKELREEVQELKPKEEKKQDD
jgi:cell shape-determining protein MreC